MEDMRFYGLVALALAAIIGTAMVVHFHGIGVFALGAGLLVLMFCGHWAIDSWRERSERRARAPRVTSRR